MEDVNVDGAVESRQVGVPHILQPLDERRVADRIARLWDDQHHTNRYEIWNGNPGEYPETLRTPKQLEL